MELLQVIEWMGAGSALTGIYLLTKKQKVGFVFFSLYNLLWLFLGLQMGRYGMMFLMSAYLLVNINGYRKWSRDDVAREPVAEAETGE